MADPHVTKITQIALFKTEIPISGLPYRLSGGRSYDALDSTLVRVDTADGISGWGEICPWGRNYLPEFAEGARAGLGVLAPALIGVEATNPAQVTCAMDRCLTGHPYAKAAIDMACWDIFGKASDQPVHALLGGRQAEAIPLLSSLYNGTPQEMLERIALARADGIQCFSAKASGDIAADIAVFDAIADARAPDDTVIVDANGGWSVPTALQILQRLDGRGLLVEQPCATLAECLRVRRRITAPFILDESAIGPDDLMTILREDAADALHIKISRVGGISRARMIRDFCAIAGISTFWEASGGSALADAAAAHVATASPAGTPHKFWSCQEFHKTRFTTGGPDIAGGLMRISDKPGLGVEIDGAALSPIGEIRA